MVSFLYLNKLPSDGDYEFPRLIYHLSIDRAFSDICADVNKKEYFYSVISRISQDVNEIEYRKNILYEFHKEPHLYSDIVSLFTRFESLHSSMGKLNKEVFHNSMSRTLSFSAAQNLIQARAVGCKRALLFVKSFYDTLSSYEFESECFEHFRKECALIVENENFNELVAFCSKYEDFSQSGYLDFRISVNDGGRVGTFQCIEHKYVEINDPELKRKGFSLFRREEEKEPSVRLYPRQSEFYSKLTVTALKDISDLFTSVSQQIFDKFLHIKNELDFYYVALKYLEYLENKNIPYCYPKISENGAFEIEDMYDLYLLTSRNDISQVIPNDLFCDSSQKGILVFGGNGSGKTVFLRSLSCLQVFAQSGLPVTARKASLGICSQIATQFAESEKYFEEGNSAGRFEQEVKELAEMVEGLKENSLVFLNETFQSTAYAEGALGLADILKYFTARKIKWVLVSHLHQLKTHFEDSDVKIINSNDLGYMRSKT